MFLRGHHIELYERRNGMSRTHKIRTFIAWCCFVSQLFGLYLINESAAAGQSPQEQRRAVSVGKPSLWSFAQAHYLLASLRDRSQGIQTKSLSENDLDANAVNRTRIDMLKTII